MFFDFDETGDIAVAAAPAGERPKLSENPVALVVPDEFAADRALADEASNEHGTSYGEPLPADARRQLLLNLRTSKARVPALGGDWEEITRRREPKRVEVLRRPEEDQDARKPEDGERIRVRLRHCIPLPNGEFKPIAASEERIDCILSDGSLPDGVERALPTIGVGHVCQVRCTGESCLRDLGADRLEDVPLEGFMVWEVKLTSIVHVKGLDDPKRYTNMFVSDPKQRLARIAEWRLRGNALLKTGRVERASEIYNSGEGWGMMMMHDEEDPKMGGEQEYLWMEDGEVLDQAKYIPKEPPGFPKGFGGDPKKLNKRTRDEKKPILLNHAMCLQKRGLWKLAEDKCTEVLEMDDKACVKALFRRGRSRIRLGDFAAAREDLQQAQYLDESIAAQVKRELAFLARREKAEDKRIKGMNAKMLNGFLSDPRTAEEAKKKADEAKRLERRKEEERRRLAGQPQEGSDEDSEEEQRPPIVHPEAKWRPRNMFEMFRGPEREPRVHVHVAENSRTRINSGPSKPARLPSISGRVSVICPTVESRHAWHPQLWMCFLSQMHGDKELIVIDTGLRASPFFSSLSDPRVKYEHVVGNEDGMTLGAKRNRALELASGDLVAHFDDDDLYTPVYLETMVKALHDGAGHVVKLKAWYTLDTENCLCGYFDNDQPLPGVFEEKRRSGMIAKCWGFSLMYRREVGLKIRFKDLTWGEDQYFLSAAQQAGVPIAYHADNDLIVLHTQHGGNLSRTCAQSLVEPKVWLTAISVHQQAYAELLANLDKLRPAVHYSGLLSPAALVAPPLRAAATQAAMSASAAELPGPGRPEKPEPAAAPRGLFVCSLFDEYYLALEKAAMEGQYASHDGQVPGPEELDPLTRWASHPDRGTKPWPTKEESGFHMIPNPLKAAQDLKSGGLLATVAS